MIANPPARHAVRALAPVLLLAFACDSPTPPPPPPPPPAAVELVSAVPEFAPAGLPLAEPITIRVVDEEGGPAIGVDVSWSHAGPGSLTGAGVVTGEDGTASAELVPGALPREWNLSDDTVTVEVADLEPLEITVTAAPVWFEPVIVGEGIPGDLSRDGLVAFSAQVGGGTEAALWSDGDVELLGHGDAESSRATGVNTSGEVVGYLSDGPVATLWSGGTRTALPSDTFGESRALDIDEAGTVYGWVGRDGRNGGPRYNHPAIWSPGGALELPFGTGDGNGMITDATDDGAFGGWDNSSFDRWGFYVGEDTVALELPGTASHNVLTILGVNEEAAAVGFYADLYEQPIRLGTENDGRLFPPGRWGYGTAITDDGVTIGYGERRTGSQRPIAVLWAPLSRSSWPIENFMDDERWEVLTAVAVNADRWILVSADHPEEGGDLVVVLKPVVWPE